MHDLAVIWPSLAACLAVIGGAGMRLSRYGDIIAEKTGMSRGWAGLILLATVTSLPEAPDIAVGDILRSCVFNLLIIVALDLLHRKESIYSRAHQGNVLSAGAASAFSAMMMSGLAVVGLVLRPRSRVLRSVSRVSLMLMVIYLLNTRFLYLYGH